MIGHLVPDESAEKGVAFQQAGLRHAPQNLEHLDAHVFGIGPTADAPPGIVGELGQQRQPVHSQTVGRPGVDDLAQNRQPQSPFSPGEV